MQNGERARSHAGFMDRMAERRNEPDGRPLISFTYKGLDFPMITNPVDFTANSGGDRMKNDFTGI